MVMLQTVVRTLSSASTLSRIISRSKILEQQLDLSSAFARRVQLTEKDWAEMFYILVAKINEVDPIALENWLRKILRPFVDKGVETYLRVLHETTMANMVVPASSDPRYVAFPLRYFLMY